MTKWRYLVVEEYFDELQETHLTSPGRFQEWSIKPRFRHAGFASGGALYFTVDDKDVWAIHESQFNRIEHDEKGINTYEMLDRLGKEGWELCTTYTMQGKHHEEDMFQLVVRHIFKRPFSE